MPKEKPVSILEKLGFTKISKDLSVSVRALNTSRNERRLLAKKRYRPWFTATDAVTYATDEYGQTWSGPANTDLKLYGFDDKSSEVKNLLKKLRS